MRVTCILLFGLLLCLLPGCRQGPSQDSVPYRIASNWYTPMKLRVDKTYDLVKTHVVGIAPQVTHLIEVTVLQAPTGLRTPVTVSDGGKLVLPYDSYITGSEPPQRMEELTISPSQWVRPTARGTGTAPKPWRR